MNKKNNITKNRNKAKNWIAPDNSLTQEEFLNGIKEAEEGSFHSVQQSMEKFDQWMKSREKK
jgi:hypothetical protein